MKGMRAEQTERSANSSEGGSAPFGVWRSEGLALRRSVSDPAVQDCAPNDLGRISERTLRECMQDDQPPVQIHREGLLG